jgi:Ca-activated chloride channel homolog
MNVWALQPPNWWPALLAMPLLLWGAHLFSKRYHRQLQREFGRREAELLGRRRLSRTRATLAVLALAGITLSLLRPVQPGREAQLAPDVVLCVDVSRSMAAGDAEPSRFDALKRQVQQLLQNGVGSRFALLAFAGEVQAIAPLTKDREAVAWLLEELAPGALAANSDGNGTNLGAAITFAAASLERVGTVGDLVLLTDGEDFAGTAQQAALAASKQGHRVYCVGYGSTAGSKIVIEHNGQQEFLQDGAGNDVITQLDVDSLARVAAAGQGMFVHDAQANTLLKLWREQLLPAAARRHLLAGDTSVVERFWWPLFVGVLLWMLRMCLPERRR